MAWRTRPAYAVDDPAAAALRNIRRTLRRHVLQLSALARTSHFLPSNATTDTGEFIDPKSFLTAKYCGHCHQAAYAQWRQTAHANSFRAPWYIKNVNLLMRGKGIEYARHCEGCHNPIALTSGAMTRIRP
jgi:hypothetical protein